VLEFGLKTRLLKWEGLICGIYTEMCVLTVSVIGCYYYNDVVFNRRFEKGGNVYCFCEDTIFFPSCILRYIFKYLVEAFKYAYESSRAEFVYLFCIIKKNMNRCS